MRQQLIIRKSYKADGRPEAEAFSSIRSPDHIRRSGPHRLDVAALAAVPEMVVQLEPTDDRQTIQSSITQLLGELRAGRHDAFDLILPLVYQELRVAAQKELAVRPSDTLSSTALVHELYLKFARSKHADWNNRSHFLSVAAVAMRHILVDRARRRNAEKRGGPLGAITLDDGLVAVDNRAEWMLDLHDALDRLAAVDERLARVVECRFFGGMSDAETAEALNINERTVRRDWIKARGLLYQALGERTSASHTATFVP